MCDRCGNAKEIIEVFSLIARTADRQRSRLSFPIASVKIAFQIAAITLASDSPAQPDSSNSTAKRLFYSLRSPNGQPLTAGIFKGDLWLNRFLN